MPNIEDNIADARFGPESCVFWTDRFPECDFATPADMEDLIGTYTVTTAYYDADLNPVSAATKPGRYAAVSRITSQGGKSYTRYNVLYRTPAKPNFGRSDRFEMQVKLPAEFGLTFWYRVFQPRGNALASLGTSVWIAMLTVLVSLAAAVPAGYALARLRLPWRAAILLLFLLPQAVPNMPVYVNIARIFYGIGLNGTVAGVVLVHAAHGLVLAVWIASAAFSAVDVSLEEAARNMGASAWTCFRTVTLPLIRPAFVARASLSNRGRARHGIRIH
jgi:ABC-type glycerol-3-phosphate transport system permease component